MFADKTIYNLNSAAVGDIIAAVPSIKYAVDTFHKTGNYLVAVYPDFRELLPFIPDDKVIGPQDTFPQDYSIRNLNDMSSRGNVCRLTPSRFKLTHYGSINLLGRVLSDLDLQYQPLAKVNVDHFGVDLAKAVVIITTYRDKQRTILAPELTKIAEYIYAKGLTPVYVGRTGKISIWKNNPAISDFTYPGFGVDLRDKTTLTELANIMGQSRAVIGMDSGPIHLAFTTQAPVVVGFTTINPEYRIPYRGLAPTHAVTPNILCNFCESDWALNFWNFQKCPKQLELADCVTKMTATKFIKGLETLNVFAK